MNPADQSTEYERKIRFFEQIPDGIRAETDPVRSLLIGEYGAIFVARGGASPPPTVVFRGEEDVRIFQDGLAKRTERIGDHDQTLQDPAMAALLNAREEAQQIGKDINPRGADSAARSYEDTVALWASRVEPALGHWVGLGRLDQSVAERIRSLPPFEQVPEVFKLEAEGIFFAKDLSKSIIYSVAPPGASQHLSMLAFDVAEFNDPEVRRILANNRWFQTVTSDLPHFTFLGVPENELTGVGLKRAIHAEYEFWVPDV